MSFMAKPRVAHPELPRNALGMTRRDYEGASSTLCAGCGHDSITAAIVEACWANAIEPKNLVKLLLNLILLAATAIPRGGLVKVTVEGSAPPRFILRSSGPSARVPPAFEKLVPGDIADLPVDAQSVQAYYAGALARVCKMAVAARLDGEDVVVEATSMVPAA